MDFFSFGLNGIYLFFLFLSFYLGRKSSLVKTQKTPDNLISLNTIEGRKILLESKLNQDYLLLSCHHIAQKNPTFCGIGSIVMALNSFSNLDRELPQVGICLAFTQDNIFNKQVNQIKSSLKITLTGITLEELKQIVQVYQIQARVVFSSEIEIDEFRNLIVDYLGQSNSFVIVNFWRKTIGQKGFAHVSPIAAYNYEEDRFLILDVARNKYPPFWVKTQELWKATATKDLASMKSRGLLLLRYKHH
ncbi:MAG: phytochelatin synthase family protein [Prochloraceae cyanobacterium]|nr:phytochelatin synthase family protein [Prochloraceae cyanobacterium]